MKNKLFKKIIIIAFIIICIISFVTPTTYASDFWDVFGKADDFIDVGKDGDGKAYIEGERIKEMSELTYDILLVIGIVVAVIIGLIIAIQFITGSVEQKAKVKETLIPYVAGCIVLFGAFGIWKLVVTILQTT